MKLVSILLAVVLLAGCMNCPTEIVIMPEKIHILSESVFDDCSVTASSELGNFPAENVLDRRIGIQWKSDVETGGVWIYFDAGVGSTKSINCILCFGVDGSFLDLTPQSMSLHKSANGADWDNVDCEWHISSKNMVAFLTETETARFFRITWSVPLTPLDIYVGRIMGGTYWEPDQNITRGWLWGMESNDIVSGPERAQYGVVKDIIRSLSISFRANDKTDNEKLREIYEDLGLTKEMAITVRPDTDPNETSLYCRLTGGLPQTSVIDDLRDSTLKFVECL